MLSEFEASIGYIKPCLKKGGWVGRWEGNVGKEIAQVSVHYGHA